MTLTGVGEHVPLDVLIFATGYVAVSAFAISFHIVTYLVPRTSIRFPLKGD
jgi:hypothetical protein